MKALAISKEEKDNLELTHQNGFLKDQNNQKDISDMTSSTFIPIMTPKEGTSHINPLPPPETVNDHPPTHGFTTTLGGSPLTLSATPSPTNPHATSSNIPMQLIKPLGFTHSHAQAMMTVDGILPPQFDLGTSINPENAPTRKQISIKDKSRKPNGKKLKADMNDSDGISNQAEGSSDKAMHSQLTQPEAGPVSRACLYQ
ncbi:hypothetical protein L6452_00779 [Arctium lappa]|uniref:Uncharacterized protein n=1 Tax=Arctium lappa TaxID=4217 RepID=A0ACB9FFP3_ARCLA|nr:hypothetical protein L6452_00779 [Arctium lappa]